MSQPIEKGYGEVFVTEDLCSTLELKVCGDNHGPFEIAARAELEKRVASGGHKWDEAYLILNDQNLPSKLLLQPAQPLLGLCLAEFVDKSSGSLKPYLPPAGIPAAPS